MKFLHLSDLHLGKIVNERNMIDDQRYMLNKITEFIVKENVNALLIAGDVYDKADPPEKAVSLFDEFLLKWSNQNINVLIISGNHDSDVRLDYGKRFFKTHNIYVAGTYKGNIEKVVLKDEYGPVNFYLMPYIKPSDVDHYFDKDNKSANCEEAIKKALKKTELDVNQRNVILSHQSVSFGKNAPELAGSEAIVSVGTIECINSSTYDNFDYVALGHFHCSRAVGKENIRYAGSLLKYSQKEATPASFIRTEDNISPSDKQFPLVELKEKGSISVEQVYIKPMRDMRCIKGTLKELTALGNITAPDDYIYAILTDEIPQLNAMDAIRDIYPNAMHLEYRNSHTKAIAEFSLDEKIDEKPFEETAKNFYSMIMGVNEMPEEEWKILEDVAKEVGIL